MVAALAISRSRVILLCVGCCSFLTVATLRLQFLLNQTLGTGNDYFLMAMHVVNTSAASPPRMDLTKRESREQLPLTVASSAIRRPVQKVQVREPVVQHEQSLSATTNKTKYRVNDRSSVTSASSQRMSTVRRESTEKDQASSLQTGAPIQEEKQGREPPVALALQDKQFSSSVATNKTIANNNITHHSENFSASSLQRGVQSQTSAATNKTTITKNNTRHFPNYFTNDVPFQTLLQRDHLVSVFSGCSIAARTYSGVKFHKAKVCVYDDCHCFHEERNITGRDVNSDTAASLLQPGDTLYVEFKKISHFAKYTLPKITVDFVLISGQNHLVPQKPQKLDYVWKREEFNAIVNNPHVTHWFLMNMDVYAQDPNHDKLHPFPYGLGSMSNHTPDTAQVGMNPIQAFKDELHVPQVQKNNSIFVGYFSMRTNKEKRKLVPQGEKLHPVLHFRQMHASSYVVSPNGDRPDCYRHYEAIGLNAMPVTQMNPKYYRHLAGNVVFNNTKWNLTELEATLPTNPRVNRRLVFEEYWMEHVERIVGRPLRWWDSSRQVRCSLAEITELVKSTSR